MRQFIFILSVSLFLAGCGGGSSSGGGGGGPVYTVTNIAPYGGFIAAVKFDPNDSTRVWLSGDDASGVYLRTSASPDWILQTTVPVDWSVYTIAIAPTDSNIIYLANHFGRGLVKTVNGGASWTTAGAGLPTILAEKRVEDFEVDPTDNTIVYAACEGGLYRSTNSGVTFGQVVSAQFTESNHFRTVAVYDGGTDRVFAANQKGGVYMSIDSGVTWTTVNTASAGGIPVSDMVYTGNALYVAYDFGYLARTVGLTPVDYTIINDASGPGPIESGMWTRIRAVPGISQITDRLYVATNAKPASAKWGFFVSLDGGGSFVKKDTLSGSSVFSMDLDPADPDHLIFGSLNGEVWETFNAGDVWAAHSDNVLGMDSFAFYEDPSDADHLIFSSTAGAPGTSKVFETIDGGTGWTRVSSLDTYDILGMYIDPADPLIMMMGTFADGLYRSTTGSGGAWTQVIIPGVNCGVKEVVHDNVDTTRLYAITEELVRTSDTGDAGLYFSANRGVSWNRLLTFGCMDVIAHPVNADEAIVCSGDVLATTDAFASVANSLGLAAFAPAEIFSAGSFDPDDPTRLLVGSMSGKLFLTENYTPAGGCTWVEITNPSTDIYITDVEIQNNVWYACCFAGDTSSLPTSTPGIMASYNQGASWYFLNAGMYPARLTWKLSASHTIPGRFYVGMWGGGFVRLED